jgi:large subunit ribosomal protein L28
MLTFGFVPAVPRARPWRAARRQKREVYFSMAAVCEVCGKHPSWGMSISHSHRRTKRRWNPNIQRVRAVVDGTPRRIHVCTSCIRAGKVTKVVS